MRVPVLIEYGVEYVTGAGRHQKARVHEVVEIKIAEATETDAPVAVSWNDAPDRVQADIWGYYPVGGEAHTRWFDGAHWRPLLANEVLKGSDGSSPDLTIDAVLGLAASKNPYHPFLGNWYPHSPAVPKKLPEGEAEDRFGTLTSTQRGAVIKMAKEKFQHLLLVGDTVYVKCPEPKIVPFVVVAPDGETRHRFLRIVTNESTINRAFAANSDDVYPVSAFDEAMTAKHLFSHPFVTAIDARRRPEVFVWDSIDEDSVLHEVADRKVMNFVMTLNDVRLGQTTVDQLESMSAIRMAVSLPKSEERFERLEHALRRCVVAWEGKYDDLESLTLLADAIAGRRLDVPFAPSQTGLPRP
ncbi:hypothetical protein O9X98_10745 [Agrobacterium salinitolerans]|nr:hypothetical protein [Agrobacterium salinitolerans]